MKYENLILSYLRGDIEPQERAELEKWLSSSVENRNYFISISRVWEATGQLYQEREYDVESALDKVNKKIDAIEADKVRRNQGSWFVRNLKYIASVAAMIALGVFSYFALHHSKEQPAVVLAVAADSSEQEFTLPDGSLITLKTSSNLQYDRHFNVDSRCVDFCGSAYFDIASNPEKPFCIHCNNVIVEVLGTSFDLVAPQDADTYYLDLYSGSVKMFSVDEHDVLFEQVVLRPGERAVYHVSSNTLEKISESSLQIMKELNGKTLEFNNAKLSLVVTSLEVSYGVEIDLDPRFGDERLTARFEGESLDVVLETISDIFDLQVVRSGKSIVIR